MCAIFVTLVVNLHTIFPFDVSDKVVEARLFVLNMPQVGGCQSHMHDHHVFLDYVNLTLCV